MGIRFDEQTAIVTGGGSGLGRCYALELAARGAKVVINDPGLLPDGSFRARKVVEEIRAKGGRAVSNEDDVGDRKAAERIIALAMDHFGRIDILMNNAGIIKDKSFLKMEIDDFVDVVRVHVLGSAYLTKAAFPYMVDAKYGRVLMTTSTAGLWGNFGQTNYAAAKMGLVGFMNALKLEGAKYNILVNTIAPIAATNPHSVVFPQETLAQIPPEKVAAMSLYLVSDQCSVTGKILVAGGGFYACAHLIEGPGVRFEAGEPVEVEQIADRFDEIISMKDARHYENATENVANTLAHLLK